MLASTRTFKWMGVEISSVYTIHIQAMAQKKLDIYRENEAEVSNYSVRHAQCAMYSNDWNTKSNLCDNSTVPTNIWKWISLYSIRKMSISNNIFDKAEDFKEHPMLPQNVSFDSTLRENCLHRHFFLASYSPAPNTFLYTNKNARSSGPNVHITTKFFEIFRCTIEILLR